MSKICKKLKNQGGASVLISLIFFLTAFMVGTVVLSSAAANSDKLIARREERQRYFALSSAARFLRSTIEGTKGTVWEEKTIYFCKNNSTIIQEAGNYAHTDTTAYSTDMEVTVSDDKIQKLLTKTAYEMYQKLRAVAKPPNIIKEFSIETEGMATVDVTLTMGNNDPDHLDNEKLYYNVQIELKVRDSEEIIKMEVKAAIVGPTDSTGTANPPTCTHRCIEKIDTNGDGIPDEDTKIDKNFDKSAERKTTEVTWPTATITKGGTL